MSRLAGVSMASAERGKIMLPLLLSSLTAGNGGGAAENIAANRLALRGLGGGGGGGGDGGLFDLFGGIFSNPLLGFGGGPFTGWGYNALGLGGSGAGVDHGTHNTLPATNRIRPVNNNNNGINYVPGDTGALASNRNVAHTNLNSPWFAHVRNRNGPCRYSVLRWNFLPGGNCHSRCCIELWTTEEYNFFSNQKTVWCVFHVFPAA